MAKSKSCGKKTTPKDLLNQSELKPTNKRKQKAESKAKQPKKVNVFDEEFLNQFKLEIDSKVKSLVQKTGDDSLL